MMGTDKQTGKVADWVGTSAASFGNKLAAIDLASGRRMTYAEWHKRVARVAGMLKARGIGKGDRVASLAMNSTDILDIMFACWRIGAIHLPLNFRLTPDELTFIVGDAEPRLAILDDVFAETGNAVCEKTHAEWLGFDGLGGDTPFERAAAEAGPVYEQVPLTLDDICCIMYSSGTTGLPKGVTLSHENLFYAVVNAAPNFRSSYDMVALTSMPLFHIGGLAAFSTTTAYMGGTTIVQRAFEPGEALSVLGDPDYGVTHYFAVPAIWNALKAHPDLPGTDLSRIRTAASGAETVPHSLVKWWQERGVTIQEVYGMTETTGGVCLLDDSVIPEKIGSAGKAFRHAPVAILDEDGNEVPVGEQGEICMGGPQITPGYWNRPDANDSSFVNGMLRSGDIGRIDADGFIYVEDRTKDMYISGGENVYPAEVENVLYEIEAIAEVAVIGVPDSRWGETGCAVVALKPDAALTLADIAQHCEGRLAKFKHPAHIAPIDALPRNATGKVLKFELRQSIPATLDLR